MSDPIPMLSILVVYNYLAQKLGPALMANRKPFRLRSTLVVYNTLQVVASCYLFYQGGRLGWLRDYSWRCQPVDYGTSPRALEIAAACYLYFLAKLTELLDTAFFVLRKKERQLSFLHLYHHTVMPIVSWGCVKYMPGGHGTFIGFVNCFVHIVMYTYYLLASLGYTNLWWKRHVTRLQLIQFCATFIHSAQLCFYDCGFPRFTLVLTLPNSVYFYYLFKDFYQKAYEPPARGAPPSSAPPSEKSKCD
ncbi:elongation of very long chain fatty acids protein AAEL008004 [Frankliniella occidentalis]|uniref:Elongation of very long chain fatty acids protein n=1 Tax=Frankliniella occidentalis TaxID=133901 RepID=A0A6J1SV77_FRAOC|nr:elongation of very long chain fatty acids protein AAEL008004 [Frankliniella occidentalis]